MKSEEASMNNHEIAESLVPIPSTPNSTINVLMMGESLTNCGGVVEVQKIILNHIAGSSISIQHISTVSNCRGEPILPKIKTFAIAFSTFLHQISFNQFDVMHSHFTERGSILRVILLLIFCKLAQKPYILHHHGAEFKEFFASLPPVFQNIVKYYFAQSAALLVLTKGWKTYFVEELGLDEEKIIVFMNPVELPLDASAKVLPESIKIVSLGRVGQRKGSFDLIKAFAQAQPYLPETTTLEIAGDGDIAQAQALITSLNLDDQVSLLGWIDKEERNKLLAETTIFALPSYNEGLPLALLEAMSWGIPVITTPVGGIPDVIDHGINGLLVTPGNIGQIAQTLIELAQNQELRTRLGAHARTYVQPLSAQNYSVKIQSLYQEVLASSRTAKSYQLKSDIKTVY